MGASIRGEEVATVNAFLTVGFSRADYGGHSYTRRRVNKFNSRVTSKEEPTVTTAVTVATPLRRAALRRAKMAGSR
jgi:hypothetical protein